jgi:hypothetical protein
MAVVITALEALLHQDGQGTGNQAEKIFTPALAFR